MSINWWTLALQALNVLILVWLLSRVFWRPVAQAITNRQDAAKKMLNDAMSDQNKVNAALEEISATRAGFIEERDALLADAKIKSQLAAKATLAKALAQAEATLAAAQLVQTRESDAAQARNATDAAVLAVDIARKLLNRIDTVNVQPVFFQLLVETIEQLPAVEKEALLRTKEGIDLISAHELNETDKQNMADALGNALGGRPSLNFLLDAELIAGFEIRTAHYSLRNSWQSDLAGIIKELKHAA